MQMCASDVDLFQEKCDDMYLNIAKSKLLQAKSAEQLDDQVSRAISFLQISIIRTILNYIKKLSSTKSSTWTLETIL